MKLSTYFLAEEHPGYNPVVGFPIRRSLEALSPGDWVQHARLGGRGIIVAMDEERVAVLWSIFPDDPTVFKTTVQVPVTKPMEYIMMDLVIGEPE